MRSRWWLNKLTTAQPFPRLRLHRHHHANLFPPTQQVRAKFLLCIIQEWWWVMTLDVSYIHRASEVHRGIQIKWRRSQSVTNGRWQENRVRQTRKMDENGRGQIERRELRRQEQWWTVTVMMNDDWCDGPDAQNVGVLAGVWTVSAMHGVWRELLNYNLCVRVTIYVATTCAFLSPVCVVATRLNRWIRIRTQPLWPVLRLALGFTAALCVCVRLTSEEVLEPMEEEVREVDLRRRRKMQFLVQLLSLLECGFTWIETILWRTEEAE